MTSSVHTSVVAPPVSNSTSNPGAIDILPTSPTITEEPPNISDESHSSVTMLTVPEVPHSIGDMPALLSLNLSDVALNVQGDTHRAEGEQDGEMEGQLPDPLGPNFKWDFAPFVRTPGRPTWSVHPQGVRWLAARLPEFDKIEGPQGVTYDEYNIRLQELRLKWKEGVQETYLKNFPAYNINNYLPHNPSAKQLRTAKRRVVTKLDNMLGGKKEKDGGIDDVITQVFHVAKRPTASTLWARSDKEAYARLEAAGMIKDGWTPDMDRQKSFPMQVKLRARLFRELPDEEQELWRAKARAMKPGQPERNDIILAFPKLFAMIGDSISSKTGWLVEIRAAGIGIEGGPRYFVERYKPVVDGIMVDYTSLPACEAYDQAFREGVANVHAVEVQSVQALPTWKPKIASLSEHVVIIRFSDMIALDNNLNIMSTHNEVRESLCRYMEQTFALRDVVEETRGRRRKAKKPDWSAISRAQGDSLHEYIDPARLPPDPFHFQDPMAMRVGTLMKMAQWLVDGEAGLLQNEKMFRWAGQQDTVVMKERKPRKQPTATGAGVKKEHVKKTQEEESESGDEGSNNNEVGPTTKGGSKRKRKLVATPADERPAKRGRKTTTNDKASRAKTEKSASKLSKIKVTKAAQPEGTAAVQTETSAAARTEMNTVFRHDNSTKGTIEENGTSNAVTATNHNNNVNVMTKKDSSSNAVAVKKKAVPKPRIRHTKGKTKPKMKNKDSDGESDEGDNDNGWVSQPPVRVAFDGNYYKWHQDWTSRVDLLDWEEKPGGSMQCDILEATRFLEASELQEEIVLGRSIDVAKPGDYDDEAVADLLDAILDTSKVLPTLSSYGAIKKWSSVCDTLIERMTSAVDAIINYASNSRHSILTIGGTGGLFAGLRCLEFLRRLIETRPGIAQYRDSVEAIIARYEMTIPQEQWRRWTLSSFAVDTHKDVRDIRVAWEVFMEVIMRAGFDASRWWFYKWRGRWPSMVKDVADETVLRRRKVEPIDLCVPISPDAWNSTKATFVAEMREWMMEMDWSLFTRGSVCEKFVWAYVMFMMCGRGGLGRADWWQEMGRNTCVWLLADAEHLEPGVLDRRQELLRDVTIKVSVEELLKHGVEAADSKTNKGGESGLTIDEEKVDIQEVGELINIISTQEGQVVTRDGNETSSVGEEEECIKAVRRPKKPASEGPRKLGTTAIG
ncbi:hypothetical protein M422DRAFT_66297 [Sphaerobolus stellatus SS14]|nr:hypothetical protein M422DRAFT_66297 [Sphaerobolus stellatus SS14]